jgi:asparagine synthase (glutamine-hydrolysing)
MGSEDDNIQIVFNGEIFNWREMRVELESLGFRFFSQTDTEVILRGYQAWGESVVKRLRGMFAIAIWNRISKTLWLVRDRAGEKPLFYCESRGIFAFGSNPAALLRIRMVDAIDQVGIACFLANSFIPHTHAAWKGLKVLPPAHALRISVGDEASVYRYWDFPRLGPRKSAWSDCRAAVEGALSDSVERCIDADVPVGVFLSGGVDSSIVAALAVKQKPRIKAFSLGFAEESHSELYYAERVAKHLGVEHHTVKIGVHDVIRCLPHLVEQYGQPFGDASAVPTFLISEFARQYVTVALSGDGGDELFGGYWRLQSGVYAGRYASMVPYWFRREVVPRIVERLGFFGKRLGALNALSLAKPGLGYTNNQSWYGRLREVAGYALTDALDDDFASYRTGNQIQRPEASVVQRVLYSDFQVQLPDAYLTKVDVASMAASLEVRAPFLDSALMEIAWSLPDRTKLYWGKRKILLKEIAARYVPSEVIYRRKMGFGMPLSSWFNGDLGEYGSDLFKSSHSVELGLVKDGVYQRTLDVHKKTGEECTRLWLLLWLEVWTRKFRGQHFRG